MNDKKIEALKSYLPYIGKDGIAIGIKSDSKKYKELLSHFLKSSKFQRGRLKTTPHGLFVRQAKNYLIKFGWCYHPIGKNGKPNKSLLCLTNLGQQIKRCSSLNCVKTLYTQYFLNYSYNGLLIVRFTKLLLQRLEYLTLDEFDYFVTHAYGEDDLETIIHLVNTYRSLSDKSKGSLRQRSRKHFEKVKERTAKNVYGNYIKNVKHTISVIAWCEGFSRDKDFVLRLTDGG